MLDSSQPLSILAKSDKKELALSESGSYPGKSDTTAILFLVDTSDPARQNVIDKNKQQIKALLKSAKAHHKFGLASFDKILRIDSAIGNSTFLLTKSLNELSAEGRTTELYRNLLKAVDYLKNIDAQRKAIILLSDGQAEDKAYFHSDVINAARESGVIINSIGYPRSIALSVALQTLRRLSEETGGNYTETDINYNLPAAYMKQAFSNIDNGGTFSVDLSDNKSEKLELIFKLSDSTKSILIPVKLNTSKADIPVIKDDLQKLTPTTLPIQKSSNNVGSIQVVTKPTEVQNVNLWLWYGLPAAFIIIIIFILITLFLLWHRQPNNKKNNTNSDYKPYAYLLAGDGTNTRYPITRTIWRIGRGKDNELTLDDTSISRRHAEIHRKNNGTFDIIDMNSMNGIYINNEKIGKAILQEGDVIEIGDIFLHFTQLASDHSVEESTVMQKTKVPITH